jgi:hypothetical protein
MGPLPLADLVARRDGWIAASWRAKDALPGGASVVRVSQTAGPDVGSGATRVETVSLGR